MQSDGFQYLFRFSWLQIFRGFLYYFAKKDIFFVLETKDIQAADCLNFRALEFN